MSISNIIALILPLVSYVQGLVSIVSVCRNNHRITKQLHKRLTILKKIVKTQKLKKKEKIILEILKVTLLNQILDIKKTVDIVGHEKKTMTYGLYSGGSSMA